jgi:hypothetical protein
LPRFDPEGDDDLKLLDEMAGKEQQPQEEIGDNEDFQMVDNASSFKNDKCPYTLKDVSVRGGGCIMSSGMGRHRGLTWGMCV